MGLTPKMAARVLRFHRAVGMLTTGTASLAEIAAACGFYDQAHLSREISDLSGITPGSMRPDHRVERPLALWSEGKFVQDQPGRTPLTSCPAVLGDIEQRHIAMGGPGGPLGCPLTEELVNPDGFGRRTQFEHGTIYWSPRTGAWPVWGAIGDYWCSQGCEAGWAGYPTSYEYTVGAEIRQNYQCAVIHFQDLGGGASGTWSDNICG